MTRLDDVTFLRVVGDGARRTEAPEAGEALLDRVLAEYDRGARFALPPVDVPERPRRRRIALAILAAAAAVIAVVVVLPTREGSASSANGTLRFSVPYARQGEDVRVTYVPSGRLAAQDSLFLRVRFRDPQDGSYGRVSRPYTVAAVLQRTRSGQFDGRFRFPDSVVYGEFVVEDAAATVVDRPPKWYWELLGSSATGARTPSFDALMQQANANLGASWERSFDAVKEGVRRYPGRVEGWRSRLFYEQVLLGARAADSLRTLHLPRVREFDARLRREAFVDAELMNEMSAYANALHDSVTASYWNHRLVREWPATPAGVMARLLAAWPALLADTSTQLKLVEYERLYASVATDPRAVRREGFNVVRLGLDAALDARDSARALTWASRYLAAQGAWSDSAYVATRLVELPTLRASQVDGLRHFIRSAISANMADRPLWATRSQWRTELERRRASLYASLGRALVESGHPAAGADSLERAARIGWSTPFFRNAASAWSQAGDSIRAARDLARIAVDPSSTNAVADSLARVAGRPAAWPQLIEDARREMRTALFAEGTRKSIRGLPRVTAMDGREMKLGSLYAGRPAVITFWSRNCGPSVQELPEVEKLWAELRARGIPFVAITDEPPSKDLRAFLAEKKLTFPVFADTRREASSGFENFGTPSYFILDSRGAIRFDQRELSTVVRNVSLLLAEAHSTN
jgi:peroxiredoxin